MSCCFVRGDRRLGVIAPRRLRGFCVPKVSRRLPAAGAPSLGRARVPGPEATTQDAGRASRVRVSRLAPLTAFGSTSVSGGPAHLLSGWSKSLTPPDRFAQAFTCLQTTRTRVGEGQLVLGRSGVGPSASPSVVVVAVLPCCTASGSGAGQATGPSLITCCHRPQRRRSSTPQFRQLT